MRLVPFEPRHLAEIAPGRFERLALGHGEGDELACGVALPGPAFTIFDDGSDDGGTPLGCGGLVPLWRGVARGWLYASDRLRGHPLMLHRTVRRALGAAEAALALHRIEITVHGEFTAGQRWAERLGFRCEGAMPGYGPNKDTYFRYARTRS